MIAAVLATAQDVDKGLPQFNPDSFVSQSFWTVITYAVLAFLLWRYVLPKVKRLLDERAAKISAELMQAEQARKEAERMLTEYEQRLAKIEGEAAKIIEEARAAADAAHHEAMQRLNEEIKKKKAMYMEEIAFAKKQALREIKDAVVDLTMLATEKLVAAKVSEDEARRMVEEVLEELGTPSRTARTHSR